MVQTGNDKRCVDKAEQRSEEYACRSRNSRIDDGGDDRADLPADRAEDKVGCHDRQCDTEERNKDHRYDRRNDLAEELLKVGQNEAGKHRRDDLCLITDHIDLDKSEIPLGNIRSRRTGNCISIEQLAGNKCETEDDSEHFRCAHLLCDGPADTDRNTDVEDRLTDEPQEMVKSCPELAQLDKRMTALENIQGVDDISETEDKTSGDDGREERSKDLREDRCNPLQRILIPLRRLLDLCLGNAGHSGDGRKIIIKI